MLKYLWHKACSKCTHTHTPLHTHNFIEQIVWRKMVANGYRARTYGDKEINVMYASAWADIDCKYCISSTPILV